MNKIIIITLVIASIYLQAKAELVFPPRVLTGNCCSACAESKISNSTLLANKYKSSILNGLNYYYNSSVFMNLMQKFPASWTRSLVNDLSQVDFRNSSNFLTQGGVDPNGMSYGSIDQGTVNFYINATKGVIAANMSNLSLNFINTAVNFLETVRINFNNMFTYVQSSGTLVDGTPADTNYITYFAMQVLMGFINSLDNQQQQSILNCIDAANAQLSNISATLPQQFNMAWQFPMQQSYLNPMTNIIDNTKILNTKSNYFSKLASIPDGYCPIRFEINNIVNNPSRRLAGTNSTGTIQLTTFDIWFERRLQTQPSIYDSIYVNLFSGIDFNGLVYNPNNVDLSTLPNGGFGPNEDVYQIWNKIVNKVFRAMLYYKIPGLAASLQQSCPMTCDQTC